MKANVVGLDIGTAATKAVWLNPVKDGFSFVGASISPTPQKGILSDAQADQEEFAQAVRRIVAGVKIPTQFVNIALAEHQAYTRVLEMPVLSDKELAQAIYWEAEQYIPVPLNTVTIDWKVLRRPNSGSPEKKMQVLLVGAPTVLIDKYVKVMSMAGLTINAIETEIGAVVRSIINSPTFPNSLVVHMGAVSTLLAVIKDGIIVFTYVIPLGGVAINRAIASEFGFALPQAEEYKKTYGYASKDFEGKIGHTIEPILISVLTEVKKILAFYSERYKSDSPIAQIVLSGGSARLSGVDLFFVQNTGIQTTLVDPWKMITASQIPKEIRERAPEFAVAVGLAMRGL